MRLKPKIIGENYLTRYHILPRNRFLNIYLHRFTGSDDARAFHDHPWPSVSFLLRGNLAEVTDEGCNLIPWLKPVFRKASHRHRLVHWGKPTWTLFITGYRRHFHGTNVARWFFYCASGRKPWYEMTTRDGKQIGGCGE